MRGGGNSQEESLSTVEVFLSLGSNLGNRRRALDEAIEALEGAGVNLTDRSSVYETEPTDRVDQPWFLNVVLRARTQLAPTELLAVCKAIERRLGRRPGPRFGPRPIDIDILLYDRKTIDQKNLTVPHPRMHERRFVLVPLQEIAPDATDPRSGRPFAETLAGLDEEKKVTRSASIAF
jgi:2-amino-4-hydroxy-6-hydroxymethyldihydropteridine diphosphokinase